MCYIFRWRLIFFKQFAMTLLERRWACETEVFMHVHCFCLSAFCRGNETGKFLGSLKIQHCRCMTIASLCQHYLESCGLYMAISSQAVACGSSTAFKEWCLVFFLIVASAVDCPTWSTTPPRSTSMRGSGDSSVVSSWLKGFGFEPCRSGGRIFFSRVNFLRWLLFRHPFHPRVTAVAHKRSQPFCQKCRWQITATETRMHLTYVALHEVTWCMVVWCTQNAPRRQQFHVAPAM